MGTGMASVVFIKPGLELWSEGWGVRPSFPSPAHLHPRWRSRRRRRLPELLAVPSAPGRSSCCPRPPSLQGGGCLPDTGEVTLRRCAGLELSIQPLVLLTLVPSPAWCSAAPRVFALGCIFRSRPHPRHLTCVVLSARSRVGLRWSG